MPTANVILNGKKLEAFPRKIRNKMRASALTTPVQHSTGNPSQSNQTRKRKGIQIGKIGVRLLMV